jgi:hypothetical protein
VHLLSPITKSHNRLGLLGYIACVTFGTLTFHAVIRRFTFGTDPVVALDSVVLFFLPFVLLVIIVTVAIVIAVFGSGSRQEWLTLACLFAYHGRIRHRHGHP